MSTYMVSKKTMEINPTHSIVVELKVINYFSNIYALFYLKFIIIFRKKVMQIKVIKLSRI